MLRADGACISRNDFVLQTCLPCQDRQRHGGMVRLSVRFLVSGLHLWVWERKAIVSLPLDLALVLFVRGSFHPGVYVGVLMRILFSNQ